MSPRDWRGSQSHAHGCRRIKPAPAIKRSLSSRSLTSRTFLLLAILLAAAALPARPPQSNTPLSQSQIMDLVKFGMNSDDLAKRIAEHGIDFEPTEAYLDSLRKAGVKEEVIQAIRQVKPKPLTMDQVGKLVASGMPSDRATALVRQRGIDFQADDKYLQTLSLAGADDAVIASVREASSAVTVEMVVATAPGAEVFLDDTSQGHADAQGQSALRAKPGIHVLKVTHDGKKAFEQNVTFAAGQTSRVDAHLADVGEPVVTKGAKRAQQIQQGQGNTICLLVETANTTWQAISQAILAVQQSNVVHPNDFEGAIAFNVRPQILTDFSPGATMVNAVLATMPIPQMREANLNDAVAFTLDRMKVVQGKKAILLICSGLDTFSKLDDAAVLRIAQSSDSPVYAISVAGFLGPATQLSPMFVQAKGKLDNLAKLTRGGAYYPQSEAEINNALTEVGLRLNAL